MAIFDPTEANVNVQLISNPARRGVTTGSKKVAGTRLFIQVEFGLHERGFVDAKDLEPLNLGDDLVSLLTQRKFGKIGDLARIVIYHKIASNLSNVFYAMQTSRTNFYAYQFKPVYKFVESLNGRILITDEVGLGKTIEAGLIWQEAQARSDARRLLVVCPSMLKEKWKQELHFRFHVSANIYDSKGFVEMLKDFQRERENFQIAAVCGLPSIRQDKVIAALEELEAAQLRFNLVIIDEAHHLRNIETKSHKAAKILSDLTDSLVLLTATPIHLKSTDLFRLLSLLDEDEFSDSVDFEQRLLANEPIIAAQNALRSYPVNIAKARSEIERLRDSIWFTGRQLVKTVAQKIAAYDSKNDSQLVEIGRLLENLNLFGSTISRTRKREVQEWRVIREAFVVPVRFSEKEAEFYDAVTNAVQNSVQSFQGNAVTAFSLMMPQRQMASCIPAMVEHYREKMRQIKAVIEDPFDEFVFDEEEFDALGESNPLSPTLQALIEQWTNDAPDSKFIAFLEALRRHFVREPDAKIIVFSYFKKTLIYLQRRLREEKISSAMIHGGVLMEERQEIIENFRNDPRLRILLSSEVGAEGIDLQFCRVIINYDLPWNPMKVEQRIGRIDRLGQKAEKISIVNFAVKGTIENRILERLYERIGIFQRSIGDLEPILGREIQDMTVELLSRHLTAEQQEARIAQTQQAIEAKRQTEAELLDQSAVLLGSSDYILEQIGQARELGRWITPEDISAFVRDFFEKGYRGTVISWDSPTEGFVEINLSNDARNELASYSRKHDLPPTKLSHSGGVSVLAFRNEAAQENSRFEMLSHFHPLIRWIVACYRQDSKAFFPAAAVKIQTRLVPAGNYLLAVEFWNFEGVRTEKRVAYSLSSLDQEMNFEISITERLLQEILKHGETWDYADRIVEREKLLSAWNRCNDQLCVNREEAFEIFCQRTDDFAQLRKAHLNSFLARKESSLTKAIETLRAKNAPEKQIKSFHAMLNGHQRRIQDQLFQLERNNQPRVEFDEVAAVVCQVTN